MNIYKITHKLTGREYIGITNDGEQRWKEHCSPSNPSPLGLAIRREGADAFTFEIIGEGEEAEIRILETSLIKSRNTFYPNGYNIMAGSTTRKVSCVHCKNETTTNGLSKKSHKSGRCKKDPRFNQDIEKAK
jgi:group I intron endonuclease